MKQISSFLIAITFSFIFITCDKENMPAEDVLLGTWIKGTNAGDTLQFMRMNNKPVLRYNRSFNSAMPAFADMEYKYHDDKLSVKLFSSPVQDFYPINTFTWKQVGSEFEIQGIELFPILSSTQVYYTYRKL